MPNYDLVHRSDTVLLRGLHRLVARDRRITAAILAHIAEVDERRLYLPAGYSSMHAYCVGELRFSEHGAFRRIRAARLARQFPAIFGALASGSVHLTAVLMLAPYLTEANASELLAAASGHSKHELEGYLVQRFGRTVPAPAAVPQLAPARVACPETRAPGPGLPTSSSPWPPDLLAPARVGVPAAGSRHRLQVMIDEATLRKLRYAQNLLSHQIPTGDVAQVFDRALDALIAQSEKRKFGANGRKSRSAAADPRAVIAERPVNSTVPQAATSERLVNSTAPAAATPERLLNSWEPQATTPEPEPGASIARPGNPEIPSKKAAARARTRHIPAHVRRAVWERDGGRCTFVGVGGHRCGTRRFLEFDHVDPVARGGRATVSGIRLLCRAHNQHEAERVFGGSFMSAKQRAARERRGRMITDPVELQPRTVSRAGTGPPENPHREAVLAALRQLGCRATEARRAAAHAMTVPGATLEESVRTALRFMGAGGGSVRARAPARG